MSEPRGRDLYFDGTTLTLAPEPGARRFTADANCFRGEPLRAVASVCASTFPDASVPFDSPEVQQARREALAWWIPLLGADFVCLTTLALDGSLCGGAITVARTSSYLDEDPFARIFDAIVVETDLFALQAAPTGPVIERYAGAPWPVTGFGAR